MYVKKAIIAKHVGQHTLNRSLARSYLPKAGDVAVFRVREFGKHESVQGVNGSNCYIFPGDYLMAAFGNRYATEQFEGYVPDRYYDEYHILGKGGAIGIVKSMHFKLGHVGPTTLELIGYATNGQLVVNTKYRKNEKVRFSRTRVRPYTVFLSLGSNMDSGKTTTAAFLCRGIRASGRRVAYIKLTGTVYTRDSHIARDCGAHAAVDFSHVGFPSTYLCDLPELLDLYETLLRLVESVSPEYVVVEIADGLLQRETDMLLRSKAFMRTVSGVIYSCGDSLSALSGIDILREHGMMPFAVSGLLTASPLLTEEARQCCPVPVLTLDDLSSEGVMQYVTRVHAPVRRSYQ